MVKLFWFSVLLSFNVFSYELDRRALDNRHVPFIPHTIPRPYLSYLSYEIEYAPVEALLEELKKTTGPLTDRDEAHITVITPPEFDNVLSKVNMTIEEINEVALAGNIQDATYEPVCIGTGSKNERTTYYVVVKSPDLIRIRRAVYELYLSKENADPKAFNPEWFFPHITLGYVGGDVHESDGLYKNKETCIPGAEITVR